MPKLELNNDKSFETDKLEIEKVYQGQVFDFESQNLKIELE